MHPYAVRGNDLYETPEVATRALLRVETLPKKIWEPACGRGAIGRVLAEAGHLVHATDLIDYGYGVGDKDFLQTTEPPPGFQCILTNPPFKHALKFVDHAQKLCPLVIMLGRLAWIEGARQKYKCMDNGTLARVWQFKKRLPFMHRDGYEGKKNSNSGMAFAWFVWDANHSGDTIIRRFSWEKPTP